MAKPTGSACNLNCDYCFFLKKEELYPGSNFRMSDYVHEAYIKQLLEAHQVPQVTVAWQGGEPTLMGLDFYRRSMELQKKRAQSFGYVLFLMTDSAVKYLDRSDGWEIGVGPSVVVVDEGIASTLTTTTLKSDVYAFVFDQKGLMAGIGLQGSKITKMHK